MRGRTPKKVASTKAAATVSAAVDVAAVEKVVASPSMDVLNSIITDFQKQTGHSQQLDDVLEAEFLPALITCQSEEDMKALLENQTFLLAFLIVLNRWTSQRHLYNSFFGNLFFFLSFFSNEKEEDSMSTTLYHLDLFQPLQEVSFWSLIVHDIMAACLLPTSKKEEDEQTYLLVKEALTFVTAMFEHLDHPIVRVELMKYMSIGMWTTMQDDVIRQHYIDAHPVAKFWRNAVKKFEKSGNVSYFLSLFLF